MGALRGRQSPELIRLCASELRANLLCRSRDFQTMGNGRNGLPAEGSDPRSEFEALQVLRKGDLGPLDRAIALNPDTKATHHAMTNQSKLHPGEFSRDIAKWHRGVIAWCSSIPSLPKMR